MADQSVDVEKDESAPSGQIPQDQAEKKPFLLQFEPGDPEDPRNFSIWRKVWYTFIVSMLAFLGLFGTSVVAPAEPVLAKYVNASIEVTTLLAALYILGTKPNPQTLKAV
jgi:hypothetical protein